MKNIFKYLGVMLFAVLGLTACSPDSFSGADPNGIPSLDGITPVVSVDQNINQVTFNLPTEAKGCMPIWIFYENKGTEKEKVTYSTVDGLKKIFAKAGDYECEFKLMNRNGISNGSKAFSFHIDNTIIDFGKYFTLLCGGKDNSTKEWRIDNSKQGHLGCGEPGTTGTNWWSAGPDDKKAFGVYDNRLTFGVTSSAGATGGSYIFDPGTSGTIYVNKDCTKYPEYVAGASEDYNTPMGRVETTYNFETVGEDLYIVFPEGTPFPYIANDDIYDNPRYRVESMTGAEINLVIDNGGIAWHYILTSGAAKPEFNGFDVNSPDNLWKKANPVFQSLYYAHGGGWEGLPDYEHVEGENSYKVILPTATDMQWQAQYCLGTDLNCGIIETGKTYDFSCKVISNNNLPSFTLKLTSPTDDPSLVNNQSQPMAINGYEETIIYFTELPAPAFDGNYKFVFDFGGNPEGTEIEIKDIVIIDHTKNMITPPSPDPVDPEPESDVQWCDPNSDLNLLNGGALALASCWWADNGWQQIGDPEVSINGRKIKITSTVANGGTQWQGQVHVNTGVAIVEGKSYDFMIKMNPTQDLSGVTVKPHPEGDDNHFFSEGRHDLAAYTENTITYEDFTADFSTDNLVITLDYPGCEVGTEIEVTEIIIQEHKSNKVSWVDVNSDENLMSKANFVLNSNWWADNGWGQIADPEVSVNGRTATIKVNVANGGSQWQGQCHFGTAVAMKEGTTYDFSITINPTQDLAGATVKPHPDGDDNHFISEGRHDLAAYADNKVQYVGFVSDFSTDNLVITLDFPGCAEGTEIEVKDIILQVHK